jgi:YVTN family beta-propeller protein
MNKPACDCDLFRRRTVRASWLTLLLLSAAAVAVEAAPFAYVTNSGSGTVSVIDVASNTVVATVLGFTGPYGVAITPDGAFAYVANRLSLNVSVIDVASNTVIATVPVGAYPIWVVDTVLKLQGVSDTIRPFLDLRGVSGVGSSGARFDGRSTGIAAARRIQGRRLLR